MNLLGIVLIIVSVTLIILILLQQRGDTSGFLGVGGGGGGGDFYQKRRGTEKTMYTVTIILIILFGTLAIGNLFLNQTPNSLLEDNLPVNTDSNILPDFSSEEQNNTEIPVTRDLNL